MAMQAVRGNAHSAEALPPRLLRFFALNPPRMNDGSTSTPTSETDGTGPARPSYYNPFMPHKHPKSGKWHPPIYSLRQQADLVKLAKKHEVEDLLPYSRKKTEVKALRRAERGLRVKGTGVGEKVKGHEWERTLKGRLEKRRQAMLAMPNLVQQWKQRGHGRGFTKWPSGKAS